MRCCCSPSASRCDVPLNQFPMQITMTSNQNDISRDVGEIKGLLTGIQQMMVTQNENVNRRIDDLHRVVTNRLDEHREEIQSVAEVAHSAMRKADATAAEVEALKGQIGKRGAAAGGGAGAIIAAGIELAKQFLSP